MALAHLRLQLYLSQTFLTLSQSSSSYFVHHIIFNLVQPNFECERVGYAHAKYFEKENLF